MPYLGNNPTYQVFPVDTFSGNGAQTTFTLSHNVSGESTILVWVNGNKAYTYQYTVNGAQLTFFSPPSVGSGNVEVYYLNVPQTNYALAQGVTSVGFVTELSGLVVRGSPINTTGTIALSGTLGVASGGTGAITFPTNQILLGNGLNPITSVSTLGSAGQVLTSNGNTAPTWTNVVNSLSFGTTGLTPVAVSTGNIVVGGTLTVSNGGTGGTTFITNDVLLGNGVSGITSVGGPGTINFVLTSTGPNTKPTWQPKPTADPNFGVGAIILCQLTTPGDYNPGTDYTGDIIIYGVGSGATSQIIVGGTYLILGAISAGNEECLVFRKA